jgi:hypothetical protein
MCFLLVLRRFRFVFPPSVVDSPALEKEETIVVSLDSVIFRRVVLVPLVCRRTSSADLRI